MEEKRSHSDLYLYFMGYIGLSLFSLVSLYLHMAFQPPLTIIALILFVHLLIVIFLSIRLSILYMVSGAEKQLGFKKITGFLKQPKITWKYKKHSFEIHYKTKEGGRYPGVLRTYIKLILEHECLYDESKLNSEIHHIDKYKVFGIKKMVRPDRCYLLMKVSGFYFDKETLRYLMGELIKIHEVSKTR